MLCVHTARLLPQISAKAYLCFLNTCSNFLSFCSVNSDEKMTGSLHELTRYEYLRCSGNSLSSSLSGSSIDGFIGLTDLSKSSKRVNVLGTYGIASIQLVTSQTSSISIVDEIKKASSCSSRYIG